MKVIVYTLPTCPWCIKVEGFLKANKIPFTERDVSSKKNLDEMIKKSEQRSVPVIDIDGKIIVGSDENKLKEALKI